MVIIPCMIIQHSQDSSNRYCNTQLTYFLKLAFRFFGITHSKLFYIKRKYWTIFFNCFIETTGLWTHIYITITSISKRKTTIPDLHFLKKTSYYFLPFFTQIHRFYFHFSFENEFNVSKNPDIRLKSMETNLFGSIW